MKMFSINLLLVLSFSIFFRGHIFGKNNKCDRHVFGQGRQQEYLEETQPGEQP